MWRLTDEAVREGVKSTTRFRHKHPTKRSSRSHQPRPQRQASGAKGGQAARRSAKMRRMNAASELPRGDVRSVPSAFNPTYRADTAPMFFAPSPPGSDIHFGYNVRHGGFGSPRPDGGLNIFPPTHQCPTSVMHQPQSMMPIDYRFSPHATERLLVNSPTPTLDESGPRTPDAACMWQGDVTLADTDTLDNFEYSQEPCLQKYSA